jgi:hypothetical protein
MAYDCSDGGADLTPDQNFALSQGAPLGQGGLFFKMGAFQDQTELYRNTSLDGSALSDLSALSYSTYSPAGKSPAYLRLTIDTNGDGDGSDAQSLYFEPALNADQGAVQTDTWQTWNAGPSSTWTTDGGPTGTTTLADFVAANPDAKIFNNGYGGGLSIIAGCAGQTQTNALLGVDRVTATSAGQTSFWDFEPAAGTNTSSTAVVKNTGGGWNASAFNYGGNGGAGSLMDVKQGFVLGPNKPVLGKGSREFTIGDNSDATQFWRSTALDGKKVDTLRSLGYSTYAAHTAGKPGADLQQPAYLRLSIDSNGPDGTGAVEKDTTLNFEPANNADQAAIVNGAWQSWDAFNGEFRVVEGPGETADALTTLAGYMSRHPNAVFATNAKSFGGSGALSFVVGSAGDNQRNGTFGVDDVRVGLSTVNSGAPSVATSVYDFEPTYTAPTADDVTRLGTGTAKLTGTAAPGNIVEIHVLKGGDYSTVAGTATADSYGKWQYKLPVTETTPYRAYLANTYGTTNVRSATAHANVRLEPTLALSTARGFSYGKVTLDPALSQVPVRLEARVNKRWVPVGHTTTNENGVARIKWDTVQGRTYQVRAYAARTEQALGNYSGVETVKSS